MSCCVDVFLSTVTTPHFSTRRFRCVIYSTMSAVSSIDVKKVFDVFYYFYKNAFSKRFLERFLFSSDKIFSLLNLLKSY